MRFLSVCSGIEAASAAWHPLGWKAAAFAEIEKFPCAVLAHHHPNVPNWGDMTRYQEWPDADVDVLVGGTPCQSFSVAGLRAGLADPRGNLTLTYLGVAARYRPRWLVWENVPGVLSDRTGAFWQFLNGLSELGYGWAWRVLDAQYFGVAQRRRRVFVVGYLGDWRRAAAVLFERESLSGNPAPRREAGQRVAGTFKARARSGGWGQDVDLAAGEYMQPVAHPLRAQAQASHRDDSDTYVPEVVGTLSDGAHMGGGLTDRTPTQDELSRCLNAGGMGRQDWETETLVVARTGGGFDDAIPFDTTQITSDKNYSRPQPGDACHPLAAHAHAPAIAFSSKDHGADAGEIAPTLRGMGHDKSHGGQLAVAFHNRQDPDVSGEVTHPLGAKDNGLGLGLGMMVRRLTPVECERLQGFEDNYTLIPYRGKPAADGPRYKALGNSMAVPVMAWIGERIELVEEVTAEVNDAFTERKV